jgi:hypothetical protein
MWIPNYTNTTGARRRSVFRRNIYNRHNDIGGTKQPSQNGQVRFQTIELYNTIQLQMNYQATHYTFGENSREYSIQVALNNSDEFNEMRRHSLKYRILGISINFNYNRIPSNGEKFPKMLITPETDMILASEQPLLNKNTMVWDMTQIGNKNYNFRITPANTEKINQEWLISESQWNAVLSLHIDEAGMIQYNYDQDLVSEPTPVLGEVKVSVRIKYIPNDITGNNNKASIKRISANEAIQEMKKLVAEKNGFTIKAYDKKGNIKQGETEEAKNDTNDLSDFKLE